MRERGREAGCFISCDVKQDGGSLKVIKRPEEEKVADTSGDAI